MFSKREELIIKVIGRRKMTYKNISLKMWPVVPTPFDDTIVVGNVVRRIIGKCKFHKLDWTLIRTRVNKKLYIKREKI